MSNAFDLDHYINQYTGGLKINRLLLIWEHSEQHSNEATKMILNELKKGKNTTIYRDVIKKFNAKGLNIPLDESWVSQVDEAASKQLEKLEIDLSTAKTNHIKESIRIGFNDMGFFYYERGDLATALKNFVRSREYCTTAKQILDTCLNVIRISIEMSNFSLVTQYVGKADQNEQPNKDKKDIGKVQVASGLANLEGRKYKAAARKFLDTPAELGSNYSEVISANDIATFGALCSLATFDRSELKSKLIDNANFKNFLELVPEVREIIKDFYDSRYTTCLSALDRIKDVLLLDIHLRPHVAVLYEQIRQRALKQYVSPFMSVDLNKMSAAFNTTSQLLEKEIAHLIMDGGIQARIDSHNKVLYSRRDNEQYTTFNKALNSGLEFILETEANIRRLHMMKADFVVKAPRLPQSIQGHQQQPHFDK